MILVLSFKIIHILGAGNLKGPPFPTLVSAQFPVKKSPHREYNREQIPQDPDSVNNGKCPRKFLWEKETG